MSTPAFAVFFATRAGADALAADLDGAVKAVGLRPDGRWAVTLEGTADQKAVVRVLDAVRRVLGPEPSSAATVLIDGTEYVMNGG